MNSLNSGGQDVTQNKTLTLFEADEQLETINNLINGSSISNCRKSYDATIALESVQLKQKKHDYENNMLKEFTKILIVFGQQIGKNIVSK